MIKKKSSGMIGVLLVALFIMAPIYTLQTCTIGSPLKGIENVVEVAVTGKSVDSLPDSEYQKQLKNSIKQEKTKNTIINSEETDTDKFFDNIDQSNDNLMRKHGELSWTSVDRDKRIIDAGKASSVNEYTFVKGSAKKSVTFKGIKYSPLDALGRTGMVAGTITIDMIQASASEERPYFTPKDNPSGWGFNDKVAIPLKDRTYQGYFYNRSHLIGDVLGGASKRYNVITGTRTQNVGSNTGSEGMQLPESMVRDYIVDNPSVTVSYVATPLYRGTEIIPRVVTVNILSSDGRLNKEIYVYNSCKGYEVDYSTGKFTSK